MRTTGEWLNEYGESHSNSTNKLLHWICVPPIVLSVFGFLASIPVPAAFESLSPWLNWAAVLSAGALAYYIALSPRLALGILVVFALMLWIVEQMAAWPWPLWLTSAVIFLLGWIGQFIGHAIEGKRPSFFKDVQFLLIGPMWLVAALYRRAGLKY